jgi:hypothetical protein
MIQQLKEDADGGSPDEWQFSSFYVLEQSLLEGCWRAISPLALDRGIRGQDVLYDRTQFCGFDIGLGFPKLVNDAAMEGALKRSRGWNGALSGRNGSPIFSITNWRALSSKLSDFTGLAPCGDLVSD